MTVTSWDFNAGGGDKEKTEFTKFPTGVTRVRIVDEAPTIRWTHWMPGVTKTGQGRSINCPGRGCAICDIRKQQKANKMKVTHQMTKRFAINVLNRETNQLEIMEQGSGFFEDVRDIMTDLQEDKLTLNDVDLKVRRRGTGKDDTSYRIDKDEVYPFSDEDKDLLGKRVDLVDYFKPHTNEQIMRVLNGEKWEDVMTGQDGNEEAKDEQIGTVEEIEIK